MRKIYWTKEKCHEASLLCKKRCEFKKKFSQPYKKSVKNGWIDEICSHMIEIKHISGYWNDIEKCRIIAKECISKSDFQKKCNSAYR